MPFNTQKPIKKCTVCDGEANWPAEPNWGVAEVVDCARCGDFEVSHLIADQIGLPFTDLKRQALARYMTRKMQRSVARPHLTTDFFQSLAVQTLPKPGEAIDNMLIWLAEQANGSPGYHNRIAHDNPKLPGIIGVIESDDIEWVLNSLQSRDLVEGTQGVGWDEVVITPQGWERYEELQRGHISSRYAFFARKFNNDDLDRVFNECLVPAVEQTGYELRTVPQRAGLIDAVIEDEIRRCRFLIADLSNDNGGAYWEAGFAEGLGKPVFYICRANHETHFDTNHRQTVRWELASLDQTGTKLKAVIRNTLLGDANQTD